MPAKRKQDNHVITSKKKRIKSIYVEEFEHFSKQGSVLVTGQNDVGQLGLGDEVMEKSRLALLELKNYEIVDVCAGGMHTVCLTKDGKVLTFGCNDEGALGRKTDDEENSEYTPGLVELPAKAKQISAGDSHTVALLEDGRAFAWGTFRDSHGGMGLHVNGNEKLPYEIIKNVDIVKVASGENHIVFLSRNAEVFTCGNGEQGQLGRVTERQSGREGRGGGKKTHLEKMLKPDRIHTKVTLKLHFDNVWCSSCGTFAKVAGNNEIYTFGLNNYGQLGLEDKKQYYFPVLSKRFSNKNLVEISGGVHHTLALDKHGKTYSIGRCDYGRLGLGKDAKDADELTEIPKLTQVKITTISAGTCTSFAVTSDGKLFSWGMGTSGQLGTGSDEDAEEPTLVTGKQLEQRSVTKVSSGGQHTVVLAGTKNNKDINNVNNSS